MRPRNRCPAITHSFCTRLWKPATLRQCGSHITCTRLDSTQFMSRSSGSVGTQHAQHCVKHTEGRNVMRTAVHTLHTCYTHVEYNPQLDGLQVIESAWIKIVLYLEYIVEYEIYESYLYNNLCSTFLCVCVCVFANDKSVNSVRNLWIAVIKKKTIKTKQPKSKSSEKPSCSTAPSCGCIGIDVVFIYLVNRFQGDGWATEHHWLRSPVHF